jgi:hypothetical protein
MAAPHVDLEVDEPDIPCCLEHGKQNKDGSCKGHPQCVAGLAIKAARKSQSQARAAELRAEKRAAKVAKTAHRFTPSSRSMLGTPNLAVTNFDARYFRPVICLISWPQASKGRRTGISVSCLGVSDSCAWGASSNSERCCRLTAP